jgi:glycosyltransferase involved in cell wall biosynthesis
MASGLPVVGVGAGAIGELLQGADWGVTYRAGDPKDYARAVCATLAHGREAGVRARAVALERYSWERTFMELITLYGRLVRDRPSLLEASRVSPTPAPSLSV